MYGDKHLYGYPTSEPPSELKRGAKKIYNGRGYTIFHLLCRRQDLGFYSQNSVLDPLWLLVPWGSYCLLDLMLACLTIYLTNCLLDLLSA